MPVKRNTLWQTNAKNLLTLTWRQYQEDNCPLIAAGLAYYALFSIVPVLILSWLGVGRFFGADADTGRLLPALAHIMGVELAQAVEGMVQAAARQSAGTLTAMSAGVLLWSSSAAFRQLQRALNFIWGVGPRKGIRGGLVSMLWAFAMLAGIGFLYMGFVISHLVLVYLQGYVNPWAPVLDELLIWSGLHLLALFILQWWLWTMVLKFLPNIRLNWEEVRVGGFVTAFLLTLGMYALGVFFRQVHTWSTFGAAASVVVVLVWLYFSSQIFLLGAEFTWAFSVLHGSQKSKTGDHHPVPPAA